MQEKCITDKMTSAAKREVLLRHPRAMTALSYSHAGSEWWQIWNCPQLRIWEYDNENVPSRMLLGLGQSESEAWIDAAKART
jgi:hypothetical protein